MTGYRGWRFELQRKKGTFGLENAGREKRMRFADRLAARAHTSP